MKKNKSDFEKILSLIKKLYKKYPDLRFGQLLTFVFGKEDIFYYSNKKVLNLLKEKIKEN